MISVIEEGVASLSGSCKMMFTMKLDPKDWDEINISRDVAGTILVKRRRRGEGNFLVALGAVKTIFVR